MGWRVLGSVTGLRGFYVLWMLVVTFVTSTLLYVVENGWSTLYIDQTTQMKSSWSLRPQGNHIFVARMYTISRCFSAFMLLNYLFSCVYYPLIYVTDIITTCISVIFMRGIINVRSVYILGEGHNLLLLFPFLLFRCLFWYHCIQTCHYNLIHPVSKKSSNKF